MSKELTPDEVRKRFLEHVAGMVAYWAGEDTSNIPTHYSCRQRLEGLVHSILAAIDGCAINLPGFALVPLPHSSDKQFHQDEGEDWFPESDEPENDIGGSLHEVWGQIVHRLNNRRNHGQLGRSDEEVRE